METQNPPKAVVDVDYRSKVDNSRPFRSVKEAVAVLSERLLLGDVYNNNNNNNNTPKPNYTNYSRPPSQEVTWFSPSPKENDEHRQSVLDSLKKLETELEETKTEMKLLKKRGSETEIALASLNAELHKNMSKLAVAEAAAARAATTTLIPGSNNLKLYHERVNIKEDILKEEDRRREIMKRMENTPTLSEILSIGEKEGYFGETQISDQRKLMMMKKKPIVPLVGDWFFKKKRSS